MPRAKVARVRHEVIKNRQLVAPVAFGQLIGERPLALEATPYKPYP